METKDDRLSAGVGRARRNSISVFSSASGPDQLFTNVSRKPEFEGKESIKSMMRDSYKSVVSPQIRVSAPEESSRIAKEISDIKDRRALFERRKLQTETHSPASPKSQPIVPRLSLKPSRHSSENDVFTLEQSLPASPRLSEISGELSQQISKMKGDTNDGAHDQVHTSPGLLVAERTNIKLVKLKKDLETAQLKMKTDSIQLQEKEELKVTLELEFSELQEKIAVEKSSIQVLAFISKQFQENQFKSIRMRLLQEIEELKQMCTLEGRAREQLQIQKEALEDQIGELNLRMAADTQAFATDRTKHENLSRDLSDQLSKSLSTNQQLQSQIMQIEFAREQQAEKIRSLEGQNQRSIDQALKLKTELELEHTKWKTAEEDLLRKLDNEVQLRNVVRQEQQNWKRKSEDEQAQKEAVKMEVARLISELEKTEKRLQGELNAKEDLEEKKSKLEVEILELNEVLDSEVRERQEDIRQLRGTETLLRKQLQDCNDSVKNLQSQKEILKCMLESKNDESDKIIHSLNSSLHAVTTQLSYETSRWQKQNHDLEVELERRKEMLEDFRLKLHSESMAKNNTEMLLQQKLQENCLLREHITSLEEQLLHFKRQLLHISRVIGAREARQR